LLRNLEEDDLCTIRDWRNHLDIKQYMFSQHEIKETEHMMWFNEIKNNCLKTINVYEENTEIKGFLQLQKKTQESNVYEWGFYISPNAVRGTGTKMALLALQKVFGEMQGEKVFGEVLNFNEPSIKLHKKLGFYQEGVLRQQHLLNNNYYDVHCFGLLKSEWLNMVENKI
jgi:UDP-4-amino-4,6-dideoxy-N-acetyl-beta-L-altrosamine N-acetyltransferase